MNTLSDENDIDKGETFFYTQERSDPIDRKDLVRLTQVVITTNQNNRNVNGPFLANNEVLDNTLSHIMMFTYQETQENSIANNEETSTQVQDDSHQV